MFKSWISLLLISESSQRWIFEAGAHSQQPPKNKRRPEIYEASFIGEEILAIVDGADGWVTLKINPNRYSKRAVDLIDEFFHIEPKFAANPKELLFKVDENMNTAGSASVIIATIDNKEKKIKFAVLGDGVYMIFKPVPENPRDLTVAEKIDRVRQPGGVPAQMGSNASGPIATYMYEHDINPGDLVLISSNGVFDNVTHKKVEEIVKIHHKQASTPEEIAAAVVNVAYAVSIDPDAIIPPYTVDSKKIRLGRGGIPDDMTVVVGYVVEKKKKV